MSPIDEAVAAAVPARRAFLTGALLTGAAAVALAPSEARADLSFGDVQGAVASAIRGTIAGPIRDIAGNTGGILETVITAFLSGSSLGLPAVFLQLLKLLLEQLGSAGDNAMTTTGTIPSTMSISWPDEAVFSSAEQQERTINAARATKDRVTEAAMVSALAAETQGPLSDHDMAVLAAVDAAGLAGHVTTQLTGIAHLISTNSQRLTQLIEIMNQHTSLHSDTTLRHQAAQWLNPQVREFQREPSNIGVPGGPRFLGGGAAPVDGPGG